MLCPIRPTTAAHHSDDWQAEWKATYAELVEVLTSIEDCLAELADAESSSNELSVFVPDRDAPSTPFDALPSGTRTV